MLKGKIQKNMDNWKRSVRQEVNGIKPYIAGKPIQEVTKEYGIKNVIKLASNENPLGVSEKVQRAINNASKNINRYPDSITGSLRNMLAKKIGIIDEMILFGNGSDGLLKIIAETFLSRDSEVIIPYPSFVEYKFVSQLMGSHLVRVWMNKYHQNLDGIAGAVTSKTKVIFLTNPHNPTGTIFTEKELEEFFKRIPDDVIVVIDEAYFEYVQDNNYPDSIKYVNKGYPLIVLRTFSKAYGLAGIRLGYAISNPEIIKILKKTRDPFNVNLLAEEAGKAVLGDDDFLQRTIDINEQGKKFLYKELDKLKLLYVPTESNFILINVGMDSIRLFNRLLKKGIIIRPGKYLGYINHIRVSIGLPEENKIFIREISKILS